MKKTCFKHFIIDRKLNKKKWFYILTLTPYLLPIANFVMQQYGILAPVYVEILAKLA